MSKLQTHHIGIIRTSKSGNFRVVYHETGYSVQIHMPNGWRDCLDCPYCATLDQAMSEMIRKETEYFKNHE